MLKLLGGFWGGWGGCSAYHQEWIVAAVLLAACAVCAIADGWMAAREP